MLLLGDFATQPPDLQDEEYSQLPARQQLLTDVHRMSIDLSLRSLLLPSAPAPLLAVRRNQGLLPSVQPIKHLRMGIGHAAARRSVCRIL